MKLWLISHFKAKKNIKKESKVFLRYVNAKGNVYFFR